MAKQNHWQKKAAALALEIVNLNKELARAGNEASAHRHAMESADKRIKDLLERNAVYGEKVTEAAKAAGEQALKYNREFERWQSTKDRLKAELAASLENVARLQGYVDRVIEDDAAREVGVIIDKSEPRTLRRGPPPVLHVAHAFGEVTPPRYGRDERHEEKRWFGL